jgi:hypothetical protein
VEYFGVCVTGVAGKPRLEDGYPPSGFEKLEPCSELKPETGAADGAGCQAVDGIPKLAALPGRLKVGGVEPPKPLLTLGLAGLTSTNISLYSFIRFT